MKQHKQKNKQKNSTKKGGKKYAEKTWVWKKLEKSWTWKKLKLFFPHLDKEKEKGKYQIQKEKNEKWTTIANNTKALVGNKLERYLK